VLYPCRECSLYRCEAGGICEECAARIKATEQKYIDEYNSSCEDTVKLPIPDFAEEWTYGPICKTAG